MITLAILVWVDFFIQCLNAYYVYDNEHFDAIYFQGYVAILCLYLVAIILVSIYLFPMDSPTTRAFLPWGFLVAAIASFALVLWIIIYITSIYDDDDVYIQKDEMNSGGGETKKERGSNTGRYRKQSKGLYIFLHIVSPLVNGLVYLLFFIWTMDWVKRNQDRQRATDN